MDGIKKEVAFRVARIVKDTNWNIVIPVVGDRTNEAHYISDLETMIKIWTPVGPRCFVVKVKEQY